MMRVIEDSIKQALNHRLGEPLSSEHHKEMVLMALKHEWSNHGYPDVEFRLTEGEGEYIVEYFRNGKKQGFDYSSGKLQLIDVEDDGTNATPIRLAKPI
jgi:hypothetical protein